MQEAEFLLVQRFLGASSELNDVNILVPHFSKSIFSYRYQRPIFLLAIEWWERQLLVLTPEYPPTSLKRDTS